MNAVPTRGLILAAGRGSRMGPATADRPKCLVELAGRPLLRWQLDALHSAGVAPVDLVVGYRSEDLAGFGCTRIANPDWSRTNMVASLLCAREVLRRFECVVSYSDIVYHPGVVRSLLQAPGELAIVYDTRWQALWSARFDAPLNDAETFRQQDGRLLDIGRRPDSMEAVQGQYMGLLKFTPRGWQAVETLIERLAPAEVMRLDMTGLLQRLLAEGMTVHTVPVQGSWCEVDSEQDLALYARLAAGPAGAWSHDWRWQSEEL